MKNIKTIALVAPSGNIKDLDELNNKIKILEQKFKIKKYYNENAKFEYLSDTDENRTKFFTNAFLDDVVDMVLSIRGGYGALRIVDKINYEEIKNSNKIYCGSSDATILLMALSKQTNITCFHSLMISNGFVENLEKNIETIETGNFNLNLQTIKKGYAKGKLWGGNLSSLVSVLSADSYLAQDDIILFIEDLNEPKYKIDKMLFEIYRNNNLKNKIKGIIFGDFYFEKDEIINLLNSYAELFDVPSAYCLDITHKKHNVTLKYNSDFCLNLV